MPNKAYAILLSMEDEFNGNIYFPIKRDGYCAGMPQFFGGTKNAGESDRDTIAREMLEESDNQITLEAGGLSLIYKGIVDGYIYNFYVATNYSGQHFLGALTNLEMASIQKFLIQVGGGENTEDLLRSLDIEESEEFATSETYTAFDCAIEWSEK